MAQTSIPDGILATFIALMSRDGFGDLYALPTILTDLTVDSGAAIASAGGRR